MVWLPVAAAVYGAGALYTYRKNQVQSSVPNVNAATEAKLKADKAWQSEIVRRSVVWPFALLPGFSK